MEPAAGGPFSVILPVRRGERHLRRSVRAAAALGPAEIVFGVDDGDAETEALARAACGEAGHRGAEVVRVPRSPAWSMHLAHVTWHCVKAARHDLAFITVADAAARPAALRGRGLVGPGGAAIASLTLGLRARSPAGLARWARYRAGVRRAGGVFSGNYWIWRPYVLEAVRMAGYAAIGNGADTYMLHAVRRAGRGAVALPDVGVDCFGVQNEDLPWRQFQAGVRHYAVSARRRAELEAAWAAAGARPGPRRLARGAARWARLAARVACAWHPHYLDGYLWARANPSHESVRAAASMSALDWELSGARHVRGLRRWGRGGAGYDVRREAPHANHLWPPPRPAPVRDAAPRAVCWFCRRGRHAECAGSVPLGAPPAGPHDCSFDVRAEPCACGHG